MKFYKFMNSSTPLMTTDKGRYNTIGDRVGSRSPMHIDSIELNDHIGHSCDMINEDATWAGTGVEVEEEEPTKKAIFNSSDVNYRFAVNASWAVNWFLLGELI